MTTIEPLPQRTPAASDPARDRAPGEAGGTAVDLGGTPANLPRGSRLPARLRILGWILGTVAIGLAALIVTVDSTLQASVAREANDQVQQEVEEFAKFAADGRDPQTAASFVGTGRLFEVYLSRQRPESTEVLLTRAADEPGLLEVRGSRVPSDGYDLAADREMLDRVLGETSGVAQTPVGEIRWGRQHVAPQTGPSGDIAVVVFLEPLAQDARETTRLMTWVGLGSLLLTTVIASVAAGQILRPVKEIRQAAEQISQEDLSRRIPVRGQDDVAELAVQFNAMLDRLQDAFVAEQRFVDDASHELRTPITIIRGHLELLPDDPDDRRATLHLVTQELDRMSRIVTDLLALAKSERPDFVQRRHGVDAAVLTLDIDAKAQALGERRWELGHIAEGRSWVDPQRLTQAVLQLAQNAVEHTGPASPIRLASHFTYDDHRRYLVFSVSDQGPGVPPEDAERIFERFGRGGDGPRSGPGAGLGLSIVRAIADAHDGWVGVDSVPGQGATFHLGVPADPPTAAPYDAASDEAPNPVDDLRGSTR